MDLQELRARLETDEARRAIAAFEARCGKFGQVERRHTTLGGIEIRDSGNADVAFTVKGHAAVYNRKSLDLGGFQEVIERGAFADVLDSAPDVWLRWDHDPRLSMARTKSPTYKLELGDDPKGLRFYSKVAPTSFAADLRILMESGIIDQASFAFSDVDDTWEYEEKGGVLTVTRTIHRVGALYDVTITAEGAYPSTDSSVARSLAVSFAMDTGRLEARSDEDADTAPEAVSEPVEAVSEDAATDALEGDSAGESAAQDEPVDVTEDEGVTDAADGADDSAAGDEDEPSESRSKRKARLRMAAAIARHRADLA